MALSGLTNVDWEDIASARIGGQALLYIGDFGDNGATRDELRIYRVQEPLLADAGGAGGVIPAADIETIRFQYPATPAGEAGGAARDAESMIVDPHSGDIYILTKREPVSRLFRLSHATSYTGIQTLEYLGDTPAIPPDSIYGISSSSTGADISRDGLEILVRNYRHILYFERPDLDTSIADLLVGDQVEEIPSIGISLPGGEPIGESICFDAAGDGFFTIGETPGGAASNPLFYYRRLPPGAPPTFSVSVSDGTLSDGPYAATTLVDPAPMEIWLHQHFGPGELADASSGGTLWGELADPDQDGRPNLVEYALGTDPRHPDLGGLTVTSSPDTLTLTYQLDTSKSDIICQPETSIDLKGWSRVGSTLVSTTGTLETRSVSIPASAAAGSRNYLRLRITSTPGAPVKAGAPPDR